MAFGSLALRVAFDCLRMTLKRVEKIVYLNAASYNAFERGAFT
jgi:hypothetical protein